MIALLRVLGLFVWIVFGSIVNGYVLSVLWGWFLVPTLGLPELSVVQAIGIAMLVRYLTYHYIDTQESDKSSDEKLGFMIISSIVRPAIALGFGWIVQSFM